MPAKFEEVVKNKLYRGGEPTLKALKILKDVFGINKIISLDYKIGNNIHSYVKELGMTHVIIGLGSGKSYNIKRLEKYIPHLLEDGPTYIHCKHGKDRTGMAVAMFRIWSGESLTDALKEAKSFGMGTNLPPHVAKSYYDAVEEYAAKNQDVANADIVEESREPASIGPAISDASVPNFGQSSFAPFEDPNASRLSRIASFERVIEIEKIASSNYLYIQLKDINSMLKPSNLWYPTKQAAIKAANNKGTIYSAQMYPKAKVEKVNAKVNDTAVNYYILREDLDFVIFLNGVVLVLSPDMLIEFKEENVDVNDLVLDVGIKDNYSGDSSMYFSPGSSGLGTPQGGYAGTTSLPYTTGI